MMRRADVSWRVLGNPGSRRVAFFQDALQRRGFPPAIILPYEELLSGSVDWATRIPANGVVRIESPGEHFEVERLLLGLGTELAAQESSPFLTRDELQQLTFDRGRILFPRQWYLGFRRFLDQCREALRRLEVRAMNDPRDIAVMFDKGLCQQRLDAAGVATPQALGPVATWEELLERMRQAGLSRVFVKLAHGSSASGVVAFERGRFRHRATTTAELVRDASGLRLYNSLKIRRYTDSTDIRDVIDTLCLHRAHVERWLPKARLDRMQFDLRVVVIAGQPQHVVVRQSHSPMTNLHLGNRRGDVELVKRRLGQHWSTMQDTCRQVMRQFPGSLYAGVDIAIGPNFAEHHVLEVNAFGDLLPGLLHQGLDTYEAELAADTIDQREQGPTAKQGDDASDSPARSVRR